MGGVNLVKFLYHLHDLSSIERNVKTHQNYVSRALYLPQSPGANRDSLQFAALGLQKKIV